MTVWYIQGLNVAESNAEKYLTVGLISDMNLTKNPGGVAMGVAEGNLKISGTPCVKPTQANLLGFRAE
jgi:hypothetical protein